MPAAAERADPGGAQAAAAVTAVVAAAASVTSGERHAVARVDRGSWPEKNPSPGRWRPATSASTPIARPAITSATPDAPPAPSSVGTCPTALVGIKRARRRDED